MRDVRVEPTRRRLLGVIAGGCALLLGTVAVTADPPRVVSVESEFGGVRERWAEIDTEIVVENPNSWAIPGSHTIEYGVTLNDIVVAVNRVGAAPSDLVAILEALKQAGALRAELVVL